MSTIFTATAQLLGWSLCFVLTTIATLAFYRVYLHPLAGIPGPKLAAVSNVWLARWVVKGRVRELTKWLHQTYGPVVRVGPGEVWVCGVGGFKEIYGRYWVLICWGLVIGMLIWGGTYLIRGHEWVWEGGVLW